MNNEVINSYLNKIIFFVAPESQIDCLFHHFREKLDRAYDYKVNDLYDFQSFLDNLNDEEYTKNHIKLLTNCMMQDLTNTQKYIILYRLICVSLFFPSTLRKIRSICLMFDFDDQTFSYIKNDVSQTFKVSDIEYEDKILVFYDLPKNYDHILKNIVIDFEFFISSKKSILKKLAPMDYEHDLDKQLLNKVRGLDQFANIVTEPHFNFILKSHIIRLTGNSIHVNEHNFPELYQLFLKCCEILDIKNIPLLFITQGSLNAETCGYKSKFYINIYSQCLNLLDSNELMFLIGHELGHIKSNHTYYQFIARQYSVLLSFIPYLGSVQSFALNKWSRMAEFTADRAGFLCCQNINAVITCFIKLAGLPYKFYSNIDITSYLNQAKEFKEMYNSDIVNCTTNLLLSLNATHPWLLLRASYISDWVRSSTCHSLIKNHSSGYVYTYLKINPFDEQHIDSAKNLQCLQILD